MVLADEAARRPRWGTGPRSVWLVAVVFGNLESCAGLSLELDDDGTDLLAPGEVQNDLAGDGIEIGVELWLVVQRNFDGHVW